MSVGDTLRATCRMMAPRRSPFARNACTNSRSSVSPTAARTVRATMPVGITAMVSAGRNACTARSPMPAPVPVPMPMAGSQRASTASRMTSTMPNQ